MSGNSMATPMVSGAAALLLQQHPNLTPDQVKARLMKTATKTSHPPALRSTLLPEISYTSQYDIFTVRAGYLDIWAALNNTDLAPLPATSPTAVYDAATGSVYVVNVSSAV